MYQSIKILSDLDQENFVTSRCANCCAEFKGLRKKCTKIKVAVERVRGQSSNDFCNMDVIDVITYIYKISWSGISRVLKQASVCQEHDERILSYINGSSEIAVCDKCMPLLAAIYKAFQRFQSFTSPISDLDRIKEINGNIIKSDQDNDDKYCTENSADQIIPTSKNKDFISNIEEVHIPSNHNGMLKEEVEVGNAEMKCEVDPLESFDVESDSKEECAKNSIFANTENCSVQNLKNASEDNLGHNVTRYLTFITHKSHTKQSMTSSCSSEEPVHLNRLELLDGGVKVTNESDESHLSESINPEVFSENGLVDCEGTMDSGVPEFNPIQNQRRSPKFNRAKALVIESMRRKGSSDERIQEALLSISETTWKQYSTSFGKWCHFCEVTDNDRLEPSAKSLLDFLKSLKQQKAHFSSICSSQAAISFLSLHGTGQSLGENASIKKFRKELCKFKPPAISRTFNWDPTPVLNYLSSLEPLEDLTLPNLALKAFGLLSLSTAHKISTIANISITDVKELKNGISIDLCSQLSVESRCGPKVKQSLVLLPFLKKCPNICPARCLLEYIQKTNSLRSPSPVQQKLFISFIAPFHDIKASTLHRWQKTIIIDSGLDHTVFLPGCFKNANPNVLVKRGIPVKTIRSSNLKIKIK